MQAESGHDMTPEVTLIGAAGKQFSDTTELHVMNYKEAMAGKDAKEWQVEVDKEHERMMDNAVWEAVPKLCVPQKTKIL